MFSSCSIRALRCLLLLNSALILCACAPNNNGTADTVTISSTTKSVSVTQVGWSKPIQLNDPEYSTPLGLANSPISGTTLQQIVNNPSVTIRPDGNSCVSCHAGPGSLRPEWDSRTLTQSQFCTLVPSFLAANKPEIVKEVLSAWANAGCPR